MLNDVLYRKLEIDNDFNYMADKLDISLEEFVKLMDLPTKSHSDYPSMKLINNFLFGIRNTSRSILKKFRK